MHEWVAVAQISMTHITGRVYMPHARVAQEGGETPLNLPQHAHLDALATQHLHQTEEKHSVCREASPQEPL